MRFRVISFLFFLLAPIPLFAASPDWKAGVAKISITPRQSIWMAGFAARTRASEGVLQELHAKALALEDKEGNRAVLVTADLLGFTRNLSTGIAERVQREYGVTRNLLLLNASHTHGGPVINGQLAVAYPLSGEHVADVNRYTRQLEDRIVQVVGEALENLRPARLTSGRTTAAFAANRRTETEEGYVIGVNRGGPVDHDVPFLVVDDLRGRLQALVFGYACHNTTLGADFYVFHGDYSGIAQEWLEKRFPGAVALFIAGAGADSNPYPRGTLESARQHGRTLAQKVSESLTGPLKAVTGPLAAAYEEVPLAFAPPPDHEELQARLASDNVYYQRHAHLMLNILEREGKLPESYPYPVQVWQFDRDLTLVALAGEVVVDYTLRLKEELGSESLWVAGYSNDVFAYIPSLRILKEGGYEAGGAMLYYGQPAPFTEAVEETIFEAIHRLLDKLRQTEPRP